MKNIDLGTKVLGALSVLLIVVGLTFEFWPTNEKTHQWAVKQLAVEQQTLPDVVSYNQSVATAIASARSTLPEKYLKPLRQTTTDNGGTITKFGEMLPRVADILAKDFNVTGENGELKEAENKLTTIGSVFSHVLSLDKQSERTLDDLLERARNAEATLADARAQYEARANVVRYEALGRYSSVLSAELGYLSASEQSLREAEQASTVLNNGPADWPYVYDQATYSLRSSQAAYAGVLAFRDARDSYARVIDDTYDTIKAEQPKIEQYGRYSSSAESDYDDAVSDYNAAISAAERYDYVEAVRLARAAAHTVDGVGRRAERAYEADQKDDDDDDSSVLSTSTSSDSGSIFGSDWGGSSSSGGSGSSDSGRWDDSSSSSSDSGRWSSDSTTSSDAGRW